MKNKTRAKSELVACEICGKKVHERGLFGHLRLLHKLKITQVNVVSDKITQVKSPVTQVKSPTTQVKNKNNTTQVVAPIKTIRQIVIEKKYTPLPNVKNAPDPFGDEVDSRYEAIKDRKIEWNIRLQELLVETEKDVQEASNKLIERLNSKDYDRPTREKMIEKTMDEAARIRAEKLQAHEDAYEDFVYRGKVRATN